MFLIPAAVTLFPIKPSKLFTKTDKNNGVDGYGRALKAIGNNVLSKPKLILGIWALIGVIGIFGTSKVIVQESQIESFQTREPIYIADKEINKRMDGTYLLDIVVETKEVEGLYVPENLRKIEALQRHVESVDHVNGSTSLVDFVKQMNKALNENQQSFYKIPDDRDLIAQLFFLFSSTGNPTDLEEEVDYDFQKANIRFNLAQSDYRSLSKIVPEIQSYVDKTFNNENIKATLSGRVSVNYAWLKTIGNNHIRSLALSLLFVFIAAGLVFRSVIAGLFAIIPVIVSLFVVYAVMGYNTIWLGVGTSMFAAISIGLGIDFAIHTLDRMREILSTTKNNDDRSLSDLFPTTGRALFFNFAALALAFSVLFISDVPPLLNFGTLVVTSVTASFVSSITILPILGKLIKPTFLIGKTMKKTQTNKNVSLPRTSAMMMLVVIIVGVLSATNKVVAQDLPDANEIIENMNNRNEGISQTRDLTMDLIDKRGKTRTRETITYRRYFGTEKRTVIFYNTPKNVKDTGFLTYDYPDADKDDDQWLYLPALKKVRRVSAADRGDYFLGTDFTYEDIKREGKVETADYTFKTIGREEIDGHQTWVVEATPLNEKIAKELGYSRTQLHIDPNLWISRKGEFWDVNGNHLKTADFSDIQTIQDIVIAMKVQVKNHKTGHTTIFTFSNVDYQTEVDEKLFEKRALTRR